MDAIFCNTDFHESSRQYFSEILRVMRDEAQYIAISHAMPPSRVPYLRRIRWAIDTCAVPEGEGLTMYVLTKTEKETLLNKKIAGAEAAVKSAEGGIVSELDQKMNKKSTTRNRENAGSITVTASVDAITAIMDDFQETSIP